MATTDDFVEREITNEITTISLWMAERRLLYEYPDHAPEAFGTYDETHIPMIQKGIIGELTTFDYFHSKLNEEFALDPPETRWEAVKDRLCLQNHVGCFDKGSDLTIGEKQVDVKTYFERDLTIPQMLNYNLFVSRNEVQCKNAADYYIQAFFTPDDTIVLAGCHDGLPQNIRYNIPTPAYYCPVPELMPVAALIPILLEPR